MVDELKEVASDDGTWLAKKRRLKMNIRRAPTVQPRSGC
jgi:hypothetical protein